MGDDCEGPIPLRRAQMLLLVSAFWLTVGSPAAGDPAVEIGAVLPTVQETDTYLHENPELGKAETKAYDFISGRLKAIDDFAYVPVEGLPTAIIAVLDTGEPGPTIALRAEIDARK